MLYHMVPAEFWNRLSGEEPYHSETASDEGYLRAAHTPKDLLAIANQRYKMDPDPYFVLVIDEDKMDAELRWEMAGDESFPQIYGLLNREAVVDVMPFPREEDGTFLMPDKLAK